MMEIARASGGGPAAGPYRLVVLDYPVRHWDDERVQRTFAQVISMRLAGYRAEYPPEVLPVDAADFVSTLMLLGKERDEGFDPFFCVRFVTLDRCRAHRVEFPPIAVARSSSATEHLRAFMRVIEDCESHGKTLGFGSTWAVRKECRMDREFSLFLRDFVTATQVWYQHAYQIDETATYGVTRFKAHLLQQKAGYEVLTGTNGNQLDVFPMFSLFGEPVLALHLKRPSADALRIARELSAYWECRIHIGEPVLIEPAMEERRAA